MSDNPLGRPMPPPQEKCTDTDVNEELHEAMERARRELGPLRVTQDAEDILDLTAVLCQERIDNCGYEVFISIIEMVTKLHLHGKD